MSNIEKIKFGDQEFELVAAGVNLGDDGGTIKFQKGDLTFEAIETILQANGAIKQIAVSGETDWSRSDLVYAGKLAKESNSVIGTAEDGVTAVTADVMTATFRTPDLTERVTALETENAALKETVGTLLVANLEV